MWYCMMVVREFSRNPVVNHRAQFAAPLRCLGLCRAVTYDASPTVEKMISINPSPKESILKYVATPDALAAWQLPHATQPTKLGWEMDPVFRQTLTGIFRSNPGGGGRCSGPRSALSVETIWLGTVRRANE